MTKKRPLKYPPLPRVSAVPGEARKPGCTGKARFPSAGAALGFLARTVRNTGSRVHYPCRYCLGWHVTSQTSTRGDLDPRGLPITLRKPRP